MSFVHPQLAAATLGLALVPILIHLLNLRRYRREPWAAMRFLLAEHERTRRRVRIEQVLLMTARILVILFVGLTIARPFVPAGAASPSVLRPSHDHVLIVDDSYSMHARRADGTAAFEAARNAALRLLDRATTGDRFAIVTTSPPHGDWFSAPTRDVVSVRRVLKNLACSQRRDDLSSALSRANELLERGGALSGCRIAHLYTDLARHALPAEAPAGALPAWSAIDRLHIFDTGPAQRENLAVVDIRAEGAALGPGVPIPLQVMVAHFGEGVAADVGVEVLLDDRVIEQLSNVELKPGTSRGLRADVVLPAAGSHRLSARIRTPRADALPLDDLRRLALVLPRRMSMLLVEGTTLSERSRQAVFFLRTALASLGERDDAEHLHIRVTTVTDLEAETLDDFAVVMVAGAARLSSVGWQRLSDYVERGGGLVLWLDGAAQPDHFNAEWIASRVRVDGRAQVLDSFRTFDAPAEPIALSVGDASHPVLREFAGAESGGLRSAWVRGHWTLRADGGAATPAAPPSAVLLRCRDGMPVLLAGRAGRGAFALALAGADLTHWNLPAKPDFVPLVWSLAAWCAPDLNAGRNQPVGGAVEERLPGRAAAHGVSIVTPAGTRHDLSPRLDGEQVLARFEPAVEAGFYRIRIGDEDRDSAVNHDPIESDLRRAAAAPAKDLLPGRTILAEEAEASTIASPAWELSTIGMFLLVIAVLLETILATSLGPRA